MREVNDLQRAAALTLWRGLSTFPGVSAARSIF